MAESFRVPDGVSTITEPPGAWPACSVCGHAWVYARRMSLTAGGYVWVWVPECKHPKKVDAHPVLVTAEGPVPADPVEKVEEGSGA